LLVHRSPVGIPSPPASVVSSVATAPAPSQATGAITPLEGTVAVNDKVRVRMVWGARSPDAAASSVN
jgi:hypothetical protein